MRMSPTAIAPMPVGVVYQGGATTTFGVVRPLVMPCATEPKIEDRRLPLPLLLPPLPPLAFEVMLPELLPPPLATLNDGDPQLQACEQMLDEQLDASAMQLDALLSEQPCRHVS